MKRLRLWYAVLLAWFCVLFNIERLYSPINLASPIYVLAPALALAMVVTPRLHRASPLVLAILAAAVVLPVKTTFGYPSGGSLLWLTAVEVGAVAITALLAGRITGGFDEFNAAVLTTMTGHLYDRSGSFTEGQAALCREIRRARIHNRPLAMLAIRARGKLSSVARARFTREVEQEMLERYVAARLGEVISTELHDSDVIVHRSDHFVILLPEVDGRGVSETMERLKSAARRVLGLRLDIGSSVFPEQEITFVRLLERAEAEMRARRKEATNGAVRKINGVSRPTDEAPIAITEAMLKVNLAAAMPLENVEVQ